jgi:hypothetical protein
LKGRQRPGENHLLSGYNLALLGLAIFRRPLFLFSLSSIGQDGCLEIRSDGSPIAAIDCASASRSLSLVRVLGDIRPEI